MEWTYKINEKSAMKGRIQEAEKMGDGRHEVGEINGIKVLAEVSDGKVVDYRTDPDEPEGSDVRIVFLTETARDGTTERSKCFICVCSEEYCACEPIKCRGG